MNIIKQYVRTNSYNETELGTSTYTETIRVFENGKLIHTYEKTAASFDKDILPIYTRGIIDVLESFGYVEAYDVAKAERDLNNIINDMKLLQTEKEGVDTREYAQIYKQMYFGKKLLENNLEKAKSSPLYIVNNYE